MTRTILSAALVLAFVSPASAQDAGGGADRVVKRERLPVLGSVGDGPPKDECVEIEVVPDGQIRIGGKVVDLAGLKAALAEASKGRYEETGPKLSRLSAILRVDRDVRWLDVQRVLVTCADPAIRVYRVLFAAVPEDGTEEGVMATHLPNDPGAQVGSWGKGRTLTLPVRLVVGGAAGGPTGRTLYAHVRNQRVMEKGKFGSAVLEADPAVAIGSVLEAVDVLFRLGVHVSFKGPRLSAMAPDAPPRGAVVARPAVEVLGMEAAIPGPSDPAMPAEPRGGTLMGQVLNPPSGEVTGEEFVNPDEEAPVAPGAGPKEVLPLDRSDPIIAGLEWLKNHQSPGGYWDNDGFESMCKRNKCGNHGGPLFDPGITGLALLPFFAQGETHKTPRYGHVVRSGLKYLKGVQDAEGCFGPRKSSHFIYNHALATLAMVETYGMTQSPLFKSSAQNGANFAMQCRNPYLAWRYGVRPSDNDTSITGWMVMALKSAERAGLEVDGDAFEGAVAWLDKVTEPEYGRVGYTARGNGPARPHELHARFPVDKTESLTAIGVFVRILCGARSDDEMVRKGVDLCMNSLPVRDPKAGTIDYVYWYYGSLAMSRVGGEKGGKWEAAMKKAVLEGQRRDPADDRYGSWDPEDPWAIDGGRIYSTAMNVLCLEVGRGR